MLDVITKDSVISLFSPANSLDLFYLCKVLELGVTTEDICDLYNHYIEKGSPYPG